MNKKEPVSKYVLSWPNSFDKHDDYVRPKNPSAQRFADEWGARRRAFLSNPDMYQHYDSSIYQGYSDTSKNKKDW